MPTDQKPREEVPSAGGCGCGPEGCGGLDRRRFIQVAGASTAALGMLRASRGGAAEKASASDAADHYVPVKKDLKPEWIKQLAERGEPEVFSGKDLETIGMPIGGIGTGQLYLVGDGRLMGWDIFNQHYFSGWGATNYSSPSNMDASPVAQGFAVRIEEAGKTVTRTLDCKGFSDVSFCGQYPIGIVNYTDAALPVAVRLEAFSPFIPLSADHSALPATVMEFTVKNTSKETIEVTLAGWLENAVSRHSASELLGKRNNRLVRKGKVAMVEGTAEGILPTGPVRKPRVLADFESNDYGDWTVEGKALGSGPAQGTLPRQNPVSGFQGKGLVNTFLGGDGPRGKLISPAFTIDRPFISFLIGGGRQRDRTCINLLVEGKRVKTATGREEERLTWQSWDVRGLQGKEARIEIVDDASGAWGHVNVDQIELGDKPRAGRKGTLEQQEDFGSMGLAVLGGPGQLVVSASLPEGEPADVLFTDGGLAEANLRDVPLDKPLVGAVGRKFALPPGQEATVPFAVVWCFPKRPGRAKKNYYGNHFASAAAVAEYVGDNFEPLARDTRLWRDTWYDSTLPYWLLNRLFSTNSYLATGTCQWWANGRFWAWEGVGCCPGTCAHVWNYEHGMARLFPQLERSVREMQDFEPAAGFVPQTGEIHFRGESNDFWAGDGQAGTILKAYREHQMSPDDQFLRRNWPRIRKALEFLIHQDKDDNGVLEGSQHNTYDINFYGPNTMIGSLYLGALRAAEEMAREMGDEAFAQECRTLFERGSKANVDALFNGEYFIQEVDLAKYPRFQYATGCLSDQLFGQGWAHQVGLGYLYPQETVLKTLESIWKYNWAPDVGPQNEHFKPGRFFALPGEAGLFTCTWPKGGRMPEPVLYKDEVWTGIEYQVAGHMAFEGMVTEALAICRGIHDRYHPSKRNPYNEVECGDHYARALASHGVFLGLCGFELHGPKKHLGFVPRITPEDFRAAFTAPEGWGTIAQRRQDNTQTNRIEVRWGQVPLATLAFELPEGAKLGQATVTVDGSGSVAVQVNQDGPRVTLALGEPITLEKGQNVEVKMSY